MTQPATLDNLLAELQKINIALKGGNLGGGSSKRESLQASAATPADRQRANQAIQKQIALMREQEELGETLTSRQELEIKQLERRAFLLEKAAAAGTPGMQEKIIALYEKTTHGQEKLNKAMEVGSGQFETLTQGMFKVSGAAGQLALHIPHTAEQLAAFTMDAKDFIQTGKIWTKLLAKVAGDTLNLSFSLEKANAEMSRVHGIAQDGYGTMSNQAKITRAVEREYANLGVTAQNASAAQGALIDKMSSFSQLSQAQKTDLTKQVAVMNELNVSVGTSAEMFDVATKALGMGANEMAGLTRKLKDVADSLAIPLSRVSEDFVAVSKQLAFYGDDVIDVFVELEKQAKATGLSMQQLVSISGEAFDTFDGAAQKVGRLNAILGGPYLNSIDMLNATEAERIELLQASMDASGTQFQDLGKFQQKAIADALGVSTEEANRLFGNLSAAEELEIKHKEEMAETARKAQTSLDKLANAFNQLLITMDPAFSLFEKFAELLNKGVDTGLGLSIGRVILYSGALAGLVKGLQVAGRAMQALGFTMKNVRILSWGTRLANLPSTIANGFRAAGPRIGQAMQFVWRLVKAPFRLIAGGLNALRSGLSFIASKALLVKAAVVGAITTISGAIYGMIRAVSEGGGIWDVLTGALLGAAAAMTKLLNLVSLGGFDKLMAMMTGGSTASQLLGTASYGQAASDVFGVNDAIITTDGKVIQPNPDDTIIAAKPQGAIAELMRGLGLGTPQGGTTAAPNQTINVNVRIGERELKDIIKEVTSESIGAFGNV